MDPIRRRIDPLPDPGSPPGGPAKDTKPGLSEQARLDLADRYAAQASYLQTHPRRTLLMSHPGALSALETGGNGSQSIQGRIDAYHRRALGPYQVDGRTLEVPAQFHMNGGFRGTKSIDASRSELLAIAQKKRLGASMVAEALSGRANPEEITRLTQALIDAHKLPPGSDGELPARIRQMQWDYGIGIDCAGYAVGAFLESRGETNRARFGFKSKDDEDLTGLPKNPHFRAVDPSAARPGDLVVLASPVRNGPGHNAIVRSHDIPDARGIAALKAKGWPDKVLTRGRVHFFEVDSSWGAGETGGAWGGVQRKVWLYNEGTKVWAYEHPSLGPVDSDGPYGHPLTGFFRAKEE